MKTVGTSLADKDGDVSLVGEGALGLIGEVVGVDMVVGPLLEAVSPL
jgi:hypothetical protein